MENIVKINYEATGKSTQVDSMGMREMQARAYAARNSQYLLIKRHPPQVSRGR
jgi:hypothetical protein